MDAVIFWEIIGRYNSQTIICQIIFLAVIIIAFILSYTGKIKWLIKLVLGVVNVYIGIVFFGYYGTEKIQKYMALPLFIICGALFIFECFKNKQDPLEKFNPAQIILLCLYMLYPAISFALGNKFPKMITHIMPCPVISLSIIIYSGYTIKNKLLLIVMALWGLTGVKAFFADAFEDLILLLCGIYCVYIFAQEMKPKAGSVTQK